MHKLATSELAAMLTALTVSAGVAAVASPEQPSDKTSKANLFLIAEHQTDSKSGTDSSCSGSMNNAKDAKHKSKMKKGKEGSCKGKEGSCKGKEGSCKGESMK